MSLKYSASYFIKKFEAIPEKHWIVDQYSSYLGGKCAQGHCGIAYTGHVVSEGLALNGLMSLLPAVRRSTLKFIEDQGAVVEISDHHTWCEHASIPWAGFVNNGLVPEYPQVSIKQRILAALRDVRELTAVRDARALALVAQHQPDTEVLHGA